MIKKIMVVIVATLLMAGSVYAISAVNVNNGIYIGGNAQAGTPPTEYILVRYVNYRGVNNTDPGVTAGQVLVWDIVSADGVTVSICTSTTAFGAAVPVAGVALTNIATVDVSTCALPATQGAQAWGYMAVRGYAKAKCDNSHTTSGHALCAGGGRLVGAFATIDKSGSTLSQDIGTLLSTSTGDDVLAPVWLRM
jgi:hypothetical protein